MTACFHGVGVGSGDPELLTIKAVRLIQSADIVCYLKTSTGKSLARDIAQEWLSTQQELAIVMPAMRINREKINIAYDQAARDISLHLDKQKRVVFLCEGDPFFYGSYIYLYQRLHKHYPCHITSGISSIHASSAIAGIPLVQQDESLAVLTSRNTDEELLHALRQFSSIVIMKAGKHRRRLIELIKAAKREKEACYIKRAGQAEEVIEYDITALSQSNGDYFSLFLVFPSRSDKMNHQKNN